MCRKRKVSPNVPSYFDEACQYIRWSAATDREYNSLGQRGTWSYAKRTPCMKPVPHTWVFKQKLLDAEGKKFIGKARCCRRGDRQMIYIDYDPMNEYAPVVLRFHQHAYIA